jgi:hypothetical protein
VSSLITFNETAPAQGQIRRQSTGPTTSLVYNITQIFPASAGTSYALTAWAAVITPADKPYCFLTVCGDSDCSFAMPITLNYTRFTYNYRSSIDESDAVATFSVECTTSAYVALDDVSVTDNALAASASSASPVSTATTTVFETKTIVQNQVSTMLLTTETVITAVPFTLPQETAYITPSPVTIHVTLTLEPDTTTIYVSVTLPPLTETAEVDITLPMETAIQTFTLSPSAEILQLTVTQPQVTDTLQTTQTLEITQYEPTITETYTPTPESSIYVPPPSSGVPAVALSSPTAIVGSLYGNDGGGADDSAYSVRFSKSYHGLYPAELFNRSHFQ